MFNNMRTNGWPNEFLLSWSGSESRGGIFVWQPYKADEQRWLNLSEYETEYKKDMKIPDNDMNHNEAAYDDTPLADLTDSDNDPMVVEIIAKE